ncbi:hypothetical protein LUZ60_001300 [Juncus effusus]|nr:hypothetical protein LUZ60_001300 [Juncus effusus]
MSNWSDLPADLLHQISKNLPSLSDFLRFRSVCTSFRSATSASDPPPQLPWLLEHRDPSTTHNSTSLRFYSLTSDSVHTVACPKSDCKWLKGPSHGYLLATHCTTDEMSLLNPFTGNEIALPFLDVAAAWPDWIGFDCVVVSGDSLVISGDSFYTDTDERTVAFCRPGDKQWVTMGYSFFNSGGHMYVCSKGMYFTVDKITKITKVIDLASKTVLHVVPLADTETKKLESRLETFTYLVESAGCILRVVQYVCLGFDIYRLDFGDGSVEPCWVRIDGIGEEMLFLDLFHGFRGLSFSASDFAGFRGNCIYFLDEEFEKTKGCILCRYDIENDTVEVLSCPFEKGGTWIVPSLC